MAVTDEFRAGWNRMYDEGAHADMWDAPWPSPELVGFVSALPDRGRAVDVGCGTGSDALFLAGAGFDVLGIDLSDSAIALATKRASSDGSRITFVQGSVFGIPVEDASVDLVSDRGLLHHVPAELHADYAREMARVLKHGGRLLIRGMSEPGRKKVPVTPESVRAHFDNDQLVVECVTGYRMLDPAGGDPATLAVIRRRAC
jgi:ubiquinone/menaquinone biosynthesis C-methylase UbiE